MRAEKFRQLKEKIIKFYCSDWFVCFLALLIVMFWTTGWEIAGVVTIVTIGCIYLLIGSDLKPVLAIFLLFVLQISLNQIKNAKSTFIIVAIIFGSIALACFTYNFIKFKNERNYKLGKLFYGMLSFFIATLFSGLLYNGYNKIYMLVVFGVGLVIYLVYFLCINCVKGDLSTRFCKILFVAGLITAVESIIFFLRQPDFISALTQKTLRIGWGMSNTLAVFFVMAVPAVIWLGLKIKAYSYIMFPACGVFLFLLFLTLSRGNLLFGVPIMIISVIFGFIKTNRSARIIFFITLVVGIALLFIVPGIKEASLALCRQGANPSGRDKLYLDALNRFLNQPVFGVGYFKPHNINYPMDGPACNFLWKVHNTVLQILSCSGIVGVLGMIPFYVQRYYILLKKFTPFKFLAFLAVLAYELEGMVDVTFLSVHQLFFVLALIAAAERETEFLLNGNSLTELNSQAD